MSSERTPSDATYHTTITQVADGDEPSAVNLNLAAEDIGDNVAWLRSRGLIMGDPDDALGGMSVIPGRFGAPLINADSRFAVEGATYYGFLQTDVTTAGGLAWDIQIPWLDNSDQWVVPGGSVKAYLHSVTLYLTGGYGAGHASVPTGADRPCARVTVYSPNGTLVGDSGLVYDAESLPGYDTVHELEIPMTAAASRQVDDSRVVLEFLGEKGLNAVANTLCLVGYKAFIGCNDI